MIDVNKFNRSIISQHLNTKAAMKDGCMYPFLMFSVYQGEDVTTIFSYLM